MVFGQDALRPERGCDRDLKALGDGRERSVCALWRTPGPASMTMLAAASPAAASNTANAASSASESRKSGR